MDFPAVSSVSHQYPLAPGSKERGGTSELAAASIATDVGDLRDAVLMCLTACGPMTADEVAERLNRDRLSIRPRVSELGRMGLIRKTNVRRPNDSGHTATVWEAIKVQQRLF